MRRIVEKSITWFIVLLLVTTTIIMCQYEHGKYLVDNKIDGSALSWIGFIPFLIPIFMLNAAKLVLPVAASVELMFWFMGDDNETICTNKCNNSSCSSVDECRNTDTSHAE